MWIFFVVRPQNLQRLYYELLVWFMIMIDILYSGTALLLTMHTT